MKFLNRFRKPKPDSPITLLENILKELGPIADARNLDRLANGTGEILERCITKPYNYKAADNLKPASLDDIINALAESDKVQEYIGCCLHTNLRADYYIEMMPVNHRHTVKFFCNDCKGTFDYIELVASFVEQSKVETIYPKEST